MARRYTGNLRAERYLGNTAEKRIHDLDHESVGADECQIDAIIAAGHDRPFNSLWEAHVEGYIDCVSCLPWRVDREP